MKLQLLKTIKRASLTFLVAAVFITIFSPNDAFATPQTLNGTGSLSSYSFAQGSVGTLTGSVTIIGTETQDQGDNGCAPPWNPYVGGYIDPASVDSAGWKLKNGSTTISSGVASYAVTREGVQACYWQPENYRGEETNISFSINVSGLSPGTYSINITGSENAMKGWGENFDISSGLSFTVTSPAVNASASYGTGGTGPTSRTVSLGSPASFPVTANTGYSINRIVTGSCPQSGWSGDTYNTGSINGDCTLNFTFNLNEPAPTASCSVSPGGTVPYNVNPTITYYTNASPSNCYTRHDNNPISGWPQPGSLNSGASFSPGIQAAGSHYGSIHCTDTSSGLNSGWNYCNYTVASAPVTPPSGTVSSSNCTIPSGGSSCSSSIVWSTSNPTPGVTSAVTTPTNITVGSANSSSTTYAISNGSRTFYLYHNGTLLAQDSATATCAANTTWNGSVCAVDTYSVSASAGANGTISPSSRTVNYGSTATFTVTPNSGYTASASGCSGSLSGSTFTTGSVTSNCSVTATFSPITYTVSASAGANGTISPSSRLVNYGSTTTFTVTPNSGYSGSVSGCGGSPLSGFTAATTYTTGAITSNCSVTATFTSVGFPSGNVTASNCTVASGAGSCNSSVAWSVTNPTSGAATSVTTPTSITVGSGNPGGPVNYAITPAAARTFYLYHNGALLHQATATATCAANTTWNGSVCAVNTYTVSASAGANGTISPVSRTVNHGSTTTFTVTPNSGYSASVSSTCGTGSLSGTTYTTAVVTADCAVTANFTSNASPSGTLSASNCTVASGGNSCNSSISWTTSNPAAGATSAVTTPTNITVGSGNNGGPVNYSITPAASRTFYLYHNAVLLAQATPVASCTSGTSWNGSTCAVTSSPVDGGWSDWGACSATACGTTGTQTRTCTNPAPSGGGASCVGASSQSCSAPACVPVVNGTCGTIHYSCISGTSSLNASGTSAWTWTCAGSGTGATSASCTELKKKPIFIED